MPMVPAEASRKKVLPFNCTSSVTLSCPTMCTVPFGFAVPMPSADPRV